jgi:protein TonB
MQGFNALKSGRLAIVVAAALLSACGSTPPPQEQVAPATPAPVAKAPPPQVFTGPASAASTPRAYRQDAATHLYSLNKDKIYKGRMPPLLYAVGVLQVDVDERGQVSSVSWMRAPRHAPEVMAQIEKMVRTAAPYPRPARMGHVTYTDTWLWHKSGRFQLDTLTEGQD